MIRDEFDYNEAGLKVKPVGVSNVQKLIANRLVNLGIRDVSHSPDSHKERKDVKVCHGFRKWFSNQCVDAGLITERRWLLEGRKLKANDPSYLRQEDQLLTEYQKAIPNLTIDPSNQLQKKVEQLTDSSMVIKL